MSKYQTIEGEMCIRSVRSFSMDDSYTPQTDEESGRKKLIFSESDVEEVERYKETFSAADVKNRLRLVQMPVRTRFLRTIASYRQYFKSVKNKITAEEFKTLESLFTNDVMAIFNSAAPQIMGGASLVNLLGASSLGSNVSVASRKLSLTYSKSLVAEKGLGDVPKALYQKLTTQFGEFFKELKDVVFKGGISELDSLEETPQK